MKSILQIFKKYSFVLGLILFFTILSRSNLRLIAMNIKNVNVLYVIAALLLTFPMFTVKALCWNYIKRKQGIKYSLKNSILMYWSGMSIGFVTPGRIGELAKVFYLKNDGYSTGKSFVSMFLDRLSDLVFLVIFILLGLCIFYLKLIKNLYPIIIIATIGILIVFVLIKRGLITTLFNKMFQFMIPKKYVNSWKINFQEFMKDVKSYSLKNYLIILLITLFSYAFYYLQIYVLSRGCGLNIPFLYLSFSMTIAGLISLLPISISGIGTRDATLILLFSTFLISREQIVTFSSLVLLASLFSTVIGLFAWLIKPLRF